MKLKAPPLRRARQGFSVKALLFRRPMMLLSPEDQKVSVSSVIVVDFHFQPSHNCFFFFTHYLLVCKVSSDPSALRSGSRPDNPHVFNEHITQCDEIEYKV